MKEQKFRLEKNGPKDLSIFWEGLWKNVKIYHNNCELGSFENKKELKEGKDFLMFTSRQPAIGKDAGASLEIGQKVSEGLIAIVKRISVTPRYVLAKGGITCSDIATRALNVKKAFVSGQIQDRPPPLVQFAKRFVDQAFRTLRPGVYHVPRKAAGHYGYASQSESLGHKHSFSQPVRCPFHSALVVQSFGVERLKGDFVCRMNPQDLTKGMGRQIGYL